MKNSSMNLTTESKINPASKRLRASAIVHSLHKNVNGKHANGIARPADDDVSRWLDEGGPGPEPERTNELARPARAGRTPVLIAAALAVGALVGILGYMRFARPRAA